MKPLKVWWYDLEPNYGDMLTPYILDWLKIPFEKTALENADTLMVGSIAKFARPKMLVLGSGFIQHSDIACPDARYAFVRGPLTRAKILEAGGYAPVIYGDAACLLPLFVDEAKKKHDVGLIPHYVDYKYAKSAYPNMPVIDLLGDPLKITKQITECRTIISSSLHGLIVAHAYGIPAAFVKMSNRLYGDGFKFHDYCASIGHDVVESSVKEPVFFLGQIYPQPLLNALCLQ